MPSLSTWKSGHTTATGSWGAQPSGGLTSADFWVVVGEHRQKWDSLQGTWDHCTLDPINLANVTDPCAFAIGKFVNRKIFVAWIELKKKESLGFEVSKVLCSRHGLGSSPNTFLHQFPPL